MAAAGEESAGLLLLQTDDGPLLVLMLMLLLLPGRPPPACMCVNNLRVVMCKRVWVDRSVEQSVDGFWKPCGARRLITATHTHAWLHMQALPGKARRARLLLVAD